jgi:hypothetical protein
MNTVFIVPTGIGAAIGGDAGDATPAFKLIASISDIAITHPNVVNASDINEMPDNTWYVEGSILDRFLEGKIRLKKPRSNKILLVVNKPIRSETFNAMNAARYTIGCDVDYIELETDLRMVATMSSAGASGKVYGWEELVNQIEGYDYDALAIATPIEVKKEVALHYFKNGGINPWGGVEAVASKLIANAINKPVAHAPIESTDVDIKTFNEVVLPTIAAEAISQCYIHCVFKGLHKAPRISDTGLSVNDIDCLVSPLKCYGRPHKACEKAGIPIITVKENTTCLDVEPKQHEWVDNYFEAAGYIQSLRAGITNSEAISAEYI